MNTNSRWIKLSVIEKSKSLTSKTTSKTLIERSNDRTLKKNNFKNSSTQSTIMWLKLSNSSNQNSSC